MGRGSQFNNAFSALQMKNTRNFNTRYSVSATGSKPKMPSRIPSQFELAKAALESQSPKEFNTQYGFRAKARKTRRRVAKRKMRKTRKN